MGFLDFLAAVSLLTRPFRFFIESAFICIFETCGSTIFKYRTILMFLWTIFHSKALGKMIF